MFLDESEYCCIGCHSKWSGSINDRLMMVLHACCVWWCCWCGVLFENSRVCFVQYVLGTTVCCVVMMCIGETGCCDSALVPPLFFGGGVGVRG